MGKRIVEDRLAGRWSWVSELPAAAVEDLPEELDGGSFLDRWGATEDEVTSVVPLPMSLMAWSA